MLTDHSQLKYIHRKPCKIRVLNSSNTTERVYEEGIIQVHGMRAPSHHAFSRRPFSRCQRNEERSVASLLRRTKLDGGISFFFFFIYLVFFFITRYNHSMIFPFSSFFIIIFNSLLRTSRLFYFNFFKDFFTLRSLNFPFFFETFSTFLLFFLFVNGIITKMNISFENKEEKRAFIRDIP